MHAVWGEGAQSTHSTLPNIRGGLPARAIQKRDWTVEKIGKFNNLMVSAAPVVLGFALLASPAYAQNEAATPEAQEIVVTGSRIAVPGIDSVAPVQVVSAEAIADSGVANVQDLLLKNPAFGTPALSRTNSAFVTSGVGIATVDLRDLGSDRTLVLINGRRVVAGLPGTSTVDLNTIPTQFIERVDILTGGSSSTYGSDAVAGVVNFIYKTNFEGIEANAQYGLSEKGDDLSKQINATFGANIADGRGNIMAHFGYTEQGGVYSRKRKNTFYDDSDLFALTGDPADFGVVEQPFYSSFAPQGSFGSGGRTFTYDPSGNLRPCFSSNGGVAPATCGAFAGTQIGPDGFNRQYYRTIAVPVKRKLFAARGHYDITDNVTAFFEGTYAGTSASREIEPFALSSEDIFPASGGLWTIEDANGVLNPLVPGAIAAAATDLDGDGRRDITFARRLNELGTRSSRTERDYYRAVIGLEGRVFSDKFKWDISYNFGETKETQSSNGQVNVLNFANALNAIVDVDDVNNNGSITDLVCASPDARAQGCAPISLFGAGSISADAAKYVAAPGSYYTKVTQQVVSGNLSGSPLDLPAGPLGVAVGFEYRHEASREEFDALTNAGLNAGNAIPNTYGSFDVREAYGEINVPIISEKPFFHLLSVRAAGRVSDYSTVGTVYSYNGGVEWAPVPDLRFRGTYARSVRAPNISELFTAPSQTFPTGLVDPCIGVTANDTSKLGVNCLAFAGVSANIAANNGAFAVTQSDRQGISGYDSGNPNLSEEKSDSFTVGAVLNPRGINALRNLSLSVDYFNIKIKGAINAAPRQFILNQCFNEGVDEFCDLIIRRPTATANNSAGSLEFVDAKLFNSGGIKTEGIDAVLNYTTNLDSVNLPGALNARIAYTHYFKGYETPLPGAPKDPYVGEIGTSQDRVNGSLSYKGERFGINFTGTYISSAKLDDRFLIAYDLEPGALGVKDRFYLDTQATFTANDHFEFYLGVDNLLNTTAPRILSNIPGNTTGTDTAADVYDAIGRRFYSGVRMRF